MGRLVLRHASRRAAARLSIAAGRFCICTRVEADLDAGVHDADLLAAFHPTLAVAGEPADTALE
ncbi:MAG: hypothetical protein H6826_08740 [Planctomycetes bacterium]|nr:hypothetical protein [Planctomycetota bacterium]